MTDQPVSYGEPAPQGWVSQPASLTAPVAAPVLDTAPVVAPPVPAQPWVSQPAAVTDPAPVEAPPVNPDPAPTQADSPAAASEPAPVPPVGSLARYSHWDPYASPARDREQLVLVTSHDTSPDGTVRVRGVVLGYADELAAFVPGELTV